MKTKKLSIPIRIKILTSLLLVVTIVVSIITYTMVDLFRKDKQTYVVDLTSFVARNIASETETILETYRNQLLSFGRVLYSEDLPVDQKSNLIKALFQDYGDFIAITLDDPQKGPTTVYDAQILTETGVTRSEIEKFREEVPYDHEILHKVGMSVQNSTTNPELPSLTMVIHYKPDPIMDSLHLLAVIRLNRIMALQGRSKVFETYLIDPGGFLISHSDTGLITSRSRPMENPLVQSFLKDPVVTKSMEYSLAEKNYLGAFAQIKLGHLAAVAQIPREVAFLTARDLIQNLLVVAFVLLFISGVASLFWAQRLTRPIERLLKATREIAQGRFDIKLNVSSQDEIGELAGSFNKMAYELKFREDALKNAQAALVQSEKMAAFGQLGAGIAHEVKNPLAGILGYAQLALRKLKNGEPPTTKHLEMIEKETRRCKDIIDNLMKFARQEKTEFSVIEPNQVIEDTLAIVIHQLTIHNITISKRLSPVLPIKGSSNQLQQVLMNLLINAQQAMGKEGGEITIQTKTVNSGHVEIFIRDTGPGIHPDVQNHIFEPFFTTKPAGKGTGLGLSVTYGIIKDHKGEIRIESRPGMGATFIISLPVAEKKSREAFHAEDHILQK